MFDAGAIVGRLELDSTNFRQAIKNAKADTNSFSGYILRNEQSIKNLGRSMTMAGTAVVVSMGLMVKTSGDFEQAMLNISTMLDAQTMNYLPKYREEIKSLMVEMGEGYSTLSKGLYDILSASIAPAEAMEVLKVSAKAAKAGLTDTGVAADAITTILNSYKLSAEKAADVSDFLFAIVKRGKTTFAELAPSIGRVASTAAASGMSLEDLGASLATMTRAGIRTEEAVVAINSLLRAFMSHTEQQTEAAKQLGIELNVNTLAGKGLIDVIQKLNGASMEQIATIFPNIRGLKGLAAQLQNTAGFYEDLELMMNRAGKAQEAYEKMTSGLNFQLGRLKQTVIVLSITIGDLLAPTIKSITEFLIKATSKITEFTEKHRTLATILATVTASFGVMALALGPLLIMLPGLVTAFTLLTTTALGPFLLVGLKIAAIAGAIYLAFKNWDLIKAVMWSFSAGVNDALSDISKNIAVFMDKLSMMPGAQKIIFQTAAQAMRGVSEEFSKNAELSSALAQQAIQDQENASSNYIKSAKADVQGLEDVYKVSFGNITNTVESASKQMTDVQKFHVTNFVEESKSMLSQFGIETMVTMQKVGENMSVTASLVTEQWGFVFSAVTSVISTIQDGLTDTIYNLITGAESIADVWKSVGKSILKTIISMLVQIATQQAVVWLMNLTGLSSHITARMASLAAETYGAAFASTAAIPIVGPALAPGVAAASTAMMLAGASTASATGAGVGKGMVTIPALAGGGDIVGAGKVIVGDGGEPEIIDLPKGARVTPLSKAGNVFQVKYIHYGDIKTDADLDATMDKLGRKLQAAAIGA